MLRCVSSHFLWGVPGGRGFAAIVLPSPQGPDQDQTIIENNNVDVEEMVGEEAMLKDVSLVIFTL